MSSSSRSDSEVSIFDAEELSLIEERCRELRREKDLLKETQSQSFDLIKRLDLHVRRLNEARSEDKKEIKDLHRELNNCHQEIDYLQDQLNEKSVYTDSLEEHISSLNVKLRDIPVLEEVVVHLTEDLNKSKTECELLTQKLETKEKELVKSCLHIEKLEESISSTALEYECEIESLRLEMMLLEQKCCDATKLGFQCNQVKVDVNENVKCLDRETQQARNQLHALEEELKLFSERVEDHFKGRLEDSADVRSDVDSCGLILGPLLSKLLNLRTSDAKTKGKTEILPHQTLEYERLVKQLKDELKEQKLRAKEESEDLAQEMAELRYQLMELLEEERKRRSCIEQASLLRISELEAQLQMEKRKFVALSRGICEP